MSEHWIDRLSEYIDGELDAADSAALEEHLTACASCRATLEELRAVVDMAATLPDVAPAADGWPAILEQIRVPDETTVLPFRAPIRRRFSFSVPQLAAAALVLILASGGSVWMLLRSGAPSAAAPAAAVPAVAQSTDQAGSPADFAARFVSQTTASYAQAVAQLETQLQQRRATLDPATIEVVERNLAIIDAAITEARNALESDPSNRYLYRHFDDTMMKKVELLRRAVNLPVAET